MKNLSLAFASLLLLTGTAGALADSGGGIIHWQSTSVTVPGPGGFFSGPDTQLLNANCVMCHSAGFVERQPPLSLSAWTMEVTKMKKAFGAPLQDQDIPPLAQALFNRQTK